MAWGPDESSNWAPDGASEFKSHKDSKHTAGKGSEYFDDNALADRFDTNKFNDSNFGGPDFDPASASAGQDSDNKCRNCGGDDHFARNCPEPRKGGACFNCGQEGHSKAECPNPRVFKGVCRLCNQEGHPASECPDRPPDVCKNCKMEGHQTMDCKKNRKFDLNGIPDKLPEEAWAIIKKASNAKDLEDFREGIKIYSKAVPDASFADIEKKLRQDNLRFYLIAMEKQVGDCHSLINLQGKLNCTYVVGFFYSSKPQRAHLKERWPSSIEDNLERLEDAGLPYDRQIPKCGNCGEMGHTTRGCKAERAEYERIEVKCVNCSALGHRARDCTEKRRDPFACRNCGSHEHKATDCPNPRSAEGVECKRCNEMGHFAKDCPQASAPRACRNCGSEEHIARDCDKPRDVSTVTCRNCDEVGHFSRDCTKKKDWSKVKCNNCGEMGHTIKRCPQAGTDDMVPSNNDTTDTWNGDSATNNENWPSAAAENTTSSENNAGGW